MQADIKGISRCRKFRLSFSKQQYKFEVVKMISTSVAKALDRTTNDGN
jgi:hypothetical protein